MKKRFEVNNIFIHRSSLPEDGRISYRLERSWPDLWIYDTRDPVEVGITWCCLVPLMTGLAAGIAVLVAKALGAW